jgi:hypothetical protein
VYLVNTETNIGYSDEAGTLAYYGAEAALEKLSADLGKLYSTKQSPTAADIAALTASMPDLGNSLKVIDYEIHFEDANGKTTDASGNPLTAPTVTAGTIGGNSPYAGLTAQIIKMLLRVTVITSTGQQVQVSREVEVALIPVFQFGAFSDEDLAYHAGADFDFGGRVHTNGSLFLASSSSAGTTLHAQVTAVKEVIRAELQNGVSTSSANKTSAIWIPTAANGCEGSKPACRELRLNEGSTSNGWSDVVNQYNTFLQNRVTALSLPFVGGGVPSFELLRRPNGESADSPLANSRMYYLAQIRVLIDDSSSALKTSSPSSATVPKTSLKVEIRKSDGAWVDVTSSWLSRGITQSDPNAILRFTASGGSNPINIYDPREGEPRDASYSAMNATSTSKDWYGKLTVPALCSYAGTINTVELNVGNLRNWLLTDSVGKTTDYATQNGYVLYYSDQRGMLPNTDVPSSHPDYNRKAGYGFTDVTNPYNSSGTPNGVLDDGEALNRLPGYTKIDPLGFVLAGYGSVKKPLTYGAKNLGDAFGVGSLDNPYVKIANDDGASQPSCLRAKLTWVSGARHALKLVNGSLGNLPRNPADGTGGFTVAAENPVYVQGNYNANGAFRDDDGHAAAAILADTVTLLSNAWADSNRACRLFARSPERGKGRRFSRCWRWPTPSGR